MRKILFAFIFFALTSQGKVNEPFVLRYTNYNNQEMWSINEYYSYNTVTEDLSIHRKGFKTLKRAEIDSLYDDAIFKVVILLTKIEKL